MNEDKLRADQALARRGLAASRERARALIDAGLATCNGRIIEKPAQRVSEEDVLGLLGAAHPYVGRGGLKLEKALHAFGVDPAGLVCMDIGASTGGFTDVLLRNGASLVYAIDVGHDQLDPVLAADPRVINMERVNARALLPGMFPEPPVLGVMDVSFISIRLILPSALRVLGGEGRVLCLVKPQFEAGRAHLGKHGVVTRASVHADVLMGLVDFMPSLGWRVQGLDYSPIAGGSGNLEFLADLVPESRCARTVGPDTIKELVARAHEAVLLKPSDSPPA